jgi:hypothetical protein
MQTSDCCGHGKTSRERCAECLSAPFERNHYFCGKLLVERDFVAEQLYHRAKQQLHNRYLHGCGIVCGLSVRPHPRCPERRVIVDTGLALDRCGRELFVPREYEVELPWREAETPDEGDPRPPEQGPPQQQAPPPQAQSKQSPPKHAPEEPCDDEPEPEPPDEGGRDLYLCLRYVECATEMVPALYDDNQCGDPRCEPNRIREGFRIEVLGYDPYDPPPPDDGDCGPLEDCRRMFDESIECVPCTHDCIVVAVIRNFVAGEPVEVDDIDNESHRVLLPSTALITKVVNCVLERAAGLGGQKLTQIASLNWTHGDRMRHEQARTLLTSHGVRVTFDCEIVPERISPATFHVLVRRHSSQIVPLEVLPGVVEVGDDRKSATFRAPKGFDPPCPATYTIVLKGDLIEDRYGRASDLNFIGGTLPTGDGVEGGTFESHFQVT